MARRLCGWCGQPPIGYAQIGDVWYCHSDNPGPSCYELAGFDAEVQANDRRLLEAIDRTAHNDGSECAHPAWVDRDGAVRCQTCGIRST